MAPFGRPFPVVCVDGEFVPETTAAVSVHANALSYGTGTFEGIRATWNQERADLFLLEPLAHYARLGQSSRVLGLALPFSPEALVRLTIELLRRNEVRADTYVRPLFALAGDGLPVGMHEARPRLSIAATPIAGQYINLKGVRCIVSPWRRAPDEALPSRAKLCGSYVGPAMAKTEAVRSGFDEAIMLNVAGHVAEATTSNVFLRRGRQWLTPPGTDDILEGITRAQAMTLLGERTGRPVVERSIDRTELYACDEIFLCGTAALVAPVTEVDHRSVGAGQPGETTVWLLDTLRAIAGRRGGGHQDWTAPVYGAGTDGGGA